MGIKNGAFPKARGCKLSLTVRVCYAARDDVRGNLASDSGCVKSYLEAHRKMHSWI